MGQRIYTYLVSDGDRNVKIGKTINFENRMKELRLNTGGVKDNVILPVLLLRGDVEHYLHKVFSQKNINREWFRLSDADVKYVRDKYSTKIEQEWDQFGLASEADNADEKYEEEYYDDKWYSYRKSCYDTVEPTEAYDLERPKLDRESVFMIFGFLSVIALFILGIFIF